MKNKNGSLAAAVILAVTATASHSLCCKGWRIKRGAYKSYLKRSGTFNFLCTAICGVEERIFAGRLDLTLVTGLVRIR